MDEKRRDEMELDWGELGGTLLSRMVLILAVTLVCAFAAFFGTKWLIPLRYTSTASIYIMNRQNNNQLSASDLNSADMLTKDCQKLAVSRGVLEETIHRAKLSVSAEELKRQMAVSVQNDTRVLDLSVTDENPGRAKETVDVLTDVTREKIQEVMGVEEVNVIDYGQFPLAPSGPNILMNTVLAGALGFFVSAAAVVIRFVMDDTIKTSDDIAGYLNTVAIGIIPNVGDEKNGRASKNSANKRR